MRLRIATVVCAALVLAACGSQDRPQADAPYFAGLDPAVVEEALANPVVAERIGYAPPAERESLYQGGVRNFIVCRDALRVYQGWLATGSPPALAPLPEPANPREPSYSAWVEDYDGLVAAVASGELERLRTWITATGGCGDWIPAKPGDVNGPTINDVVHGAE